MIGLREAARGNALFPELSRVRSFFPFTEGSFLVIEPSWRQVSDNNQKHLEPAHG